MKNTTLHTINNTTGSVTLSLVSTCILKIKADSVNSGLAFFMPNKFYHNTGSTNYCLSVVYMPIQRNKSEIVNPLHINNEILALLQSN